MSEHQEAYNVNRELAGLLDSVRELADLRTRDGWDAVRDELAAKDARIAELERELRQRDGRRCGTCELGAI